VAQLETKETNNNDVIGFITGLKTNESNLEGAAR
jgi:hypothetical protein